MGAANSNVRQKVIANKRKMMSIYASSPTSFNEDPAERQRKSQFKLMLPVNFLAKLMVMFLL